MACLQHSRQFFREIAEIRALYLENSVLAGSVGIKTADLRFMVGFAAIIAFKRMVYRLFVKRADSRSFAFESFSYRLGETLAVGLAAFCRSVRQGRVELLFDEFRYAVVLVCSGYTVGSGFDLRYTAFAFPASDGKTSNHSWCGGYVSV